MLNDFKKFILRGNVVDLAIGVLIGASFNSVVMSLTKDILTPLITLFGGNPNFSSYYFVIKNTKFLYGDFLNVLVSFLIVALTVFFLVVLPMNKLVELSRRGKTADPTTKKCLFCLSEINKDAKKCPFCTSSLPKK